MKDGTVFKGGAVILGLAAVRGLDRWLPDFVPVGVPDWLLAAILLAKYASGIWTTHSCLRRFLHLLSGERK